MKKRTLVFLVAIGLLVTQSFSAKAQFTISDVKYWVGTGSDTSILIVDFHDATWDTSYAWGYLHNSGATGQDMLNAVAATDVNFSVAIGSGFLNDIVYGSHSGIGGTGGFYWSTWSGSSITTMTMNGGISASLSNGDWFGCAFTDFSPALAPGEPIPAFNPFNFKAQDVTFWVGAGTDTTLLVIDFLDGSGTSSYAWGYLHSGTVTAQQMLNDIDVADPSLTVAISSGFLNDITYKTHSGIGGSPDNWGTWSAANLGNWDMNMGISTTLGNGDLFGCSYMNFTPVVRPGYPTAASLPTAIIDYQQSANILIYPNPANDILNINIPKDEPVNITIIDIAGRTVSQQTATENIISMDLRNLAPGVYQLKIQGNSINTNQTFIKR